MTKECSRYNFQPGGFCTITSSNLNAIKVGSRVVYASAPGATSLDSDIIIVRHGNSIAYGHVFLEQRRTQLGLGRGLQVQPTCLS